MIHRVQKSLEIIVHRYRKRITQRNADFVGRVVVMPARNGKSALQPRVPRNRRRRNEHQAKRHFQMSAARLC